VESASLVGLLDDHARSIEASSGARSSELPSLPQNRVALGPSHSANQIRKEDGIVTPPKTTDTGRSTAAPSSSTSERKPWKKKTPFEVVLEQINKVRDDVTAKENELKEAKRQLEKLEAARKVLEST
jgi:hypothetical protein